METRLSDKERDALLLLGRRGAGGDFDEIAMARLFELGLVEVRTTDRRLVLTDDGRDVYSLLSAAPTNGSRGR